ncbi:MAG TPA: M28 family peptidase [Melioribacteraceae bacterium]|nr:M28 family peptidase [Melioribacteraceae bacterium]
MIKYLAAFVFLFTNLCIAQNNITERIRTHLDYLGSDLFKGRGTGTTGGNLAAKYLAEEFFKANLMPAGNNGTFYQYIPMHAYKPSLSSKLILTNSNYNDTLFIDKDFLIFQISEDFSSNRTLDAVFVGYGINAPEYDYNDYLNINVEDKIVVMLEGEPSSDDITFFEGKKETIYTSLAVKLRLAVSKGARGCIIIPNPLNNTPAAWNYLKQTYSFEHLSLAYSSSVNLGMIINFQKASLLFNNSKYSLNDVLKLTKDHKIYSFPLSVKISVSGTYKRRDFLAPNIIGKITGIDNNLKDKFILVSAHYDHLGIGEKVKGDSIYNGVFDNAAGVAALLELANYFSKEKTRHSIIFLLTTGEEAGLLGSAYYTTNPVVPLYKTIANINIDGISSFDSVKGIIGIGAEYSSLQSVLEQTAKKNNLSVDKIPDIFYQSEAYSRSDQISFANAGIPSILISESINYVNLSYEEGLNKYLKYINDIYHSPFDDLSQPINFNAFIQHYNIIKDFINILDNTMDEPEWNEGVFYLIERLRSRAEKR